jgi:3-dehydroquinate synthase
MSPETAFKSQVIIRHQWPTGLLDSDNCFLLYDKELEKVFEDNYDFQDFIESFPFRLGVRAGESIKSFRDFPKNLEIVLARWPQPIKRSQTLVVLGGGSLGDFAGFVASILKRGVGLVHIPSTWLAAMDSAHGGKTALNLGGVKNQVGTFYPAQKIYVIKDLLENSPVLMKEQSYGELIKMGLIGRSQFFKEIMLEKRPPQDFMWRFLKNCIEDKYEVILQDPYETKKIRQALNFGHTFGHALEAHHGWPHGDSVLQGIFFALEWSRYRGDLAAKTFESIDQTIRQCFQRVPAHELNWYRPSSQKVIAKLIEQDKKITADGELLFVFLKTIGRPLLKSVSLTDLLSEGKRQNWLK